MRLVRIVFHFVCLLLVFGQYNAQFGMAESVDNVIMTGFATESVKCPIEKSTSGWNAPLLPVFEQAAEDYDCPIELLLVLGQMGSAFENRGSLPTIEQGYGVMALRQNRWGSRSIALASRLTGIHISQLKVDPIANICGAAAVLDAYAWQERIDRTKGVEAWLPVVIRYAGLDVENSQLFAMELYQKLQRGFTVTNRRGEQFSVAPVSMDIALERLVPPAVVMSEPDYWSAIWDPAGTCNYKAISTSKNKVVIHMAEGTAAGIRAWYKDCAAAESMHYVVSEVGTVWQMVHEHHIAEQRTCYNNLAVGITHAGFSSSPSHPISLYVGSALLCRDVCNRWSIPKRHATNGATGIMGHMDLDKCCCYGNAQDPGLGWDWKYYLDHVFETTPAKILSAVSRRRHGSAGYFDIDITDPSAVEPRNLGPRILVVTTDRPIECIGEADPSDVELSSGIVRDVSVMGCELEILMGDARNNTMLNVSFPGVVCTDYGIGVLDTLRFAVFLGDVNGDRKCNIFDMLKVRDAMPTEVNNSNFTCDVYDDGRFGPADLQRIRNNLDKAISN